MRMLLMGALAAFALSTAYAQTAHAQDEPVAAPSPESRPGDVVVRGAIERPVPTPPGDPRTDAQRMQDVRAWDRCVMQAQSAADTDPTRYQADSPEELCRRNLGMADRTALPVRRN